MGVHATSGAWVVKATWDDAAAHIAAGGEATWVTKKPPKAWQPGDKLYFWQGRQICEVQALGELVSTSPARDAEGNTHFKVRYTPVFLTIAQVLPSFARTQCFDTHRSSKLARLARSSDLRPSSTNAWPRSSARATRSPGRLQDLRSLCGFSLEPTEYYP